MKMKKSLKRIISMILVLILSFAVTVSNITVSAADSASLIESYRLISSPVKVTSPSYGAGSPWKTFVNSTSITDNLGVVYKVEFPDMTGKEFKNFIFRFSTSYYGGGSLRVMGVSPAYDVPSMSYTDEPFKSMWANEKNYIINEGSIASDNFSANYFMNYADITDYANECLSNGASFMYIVVNSSSTAKAFGSNITDTDYNRLDLFPYYYYDTKFVQTSSSATTIEEYKAISDPVLITGTTYGPGSPWKSFTNSVSISDNQGVIYRIDLPKLNGKEFKNFIFRFGTSYYGGGSMRVMGVPADTDVEKLSSSDEPFKSMWANESDYLSNAGSVLSESPLSNYFFNYADLTGYANECAARGDKYMYIAVNSSSTAKAYGSNITDSDYRRYDLFPYYYYDTRDLSATTANVLKNIRGRIESGKMTHPYIHGSLEKIEEIRKNLESGDRWTTEFYAKVKKNADSLAAGSPTSYGTQVSQSYGGEDNFITLMIAYHIEGDEKYLNRAIAEFEMFMKIDDWTADAQLDNTQTGATISIGYDWLYDYLTPEQRTWAETMVKEKVLSIGYRYYQDPSSLTQIRQENDYMNIVCGRGTYNHNTHNNANLLVCALAFAPLDPEYSAFIIANNFYNVEPYLELVGTNGGHEEPIGYYSYTSTKICSMLSAANSALGTMYGFENYPGFASTAYYPMQMYGAGPFSIGDCSNGKGVYNSNPLYFFAKHSNDINLLSVLASRYENGGCARMLLWYDKGELDNIDITKRLSMDAHLYPTSHGQNIAAFRDNWDISKGFYAAMYTGCASANGHSDAVSGAFCIDAFGERFVTPIGIGNYSYTNYWDHAQNGGGRWVWYEKRPEGGNCLVINPSYEVGQNVSVTAVMDEFESSEGTAYAITDLSEVYGDYVTQYKRGMLISDNRSTVTVQDEAKMKEPSEIFWSINTMAKIDIIDNETAILTNNGKKVMVKVSSDIDYTLYRMKAEKLPTSPQSDEQRDYPGFSKLAISASDVSEMTLSVKFYPLANDYEWKDEDFTHTSMDLWSTDEEYEEKPTLGAIYVDGEPLDGFEPDRYNYEVTYDVIPDRLPEIEAVSGDYEVDITYPKNGKIEIVIAVKGETRTAYYTIGFRQTTSNLTATKKTIGGSNFTTSTYNLALKDSVGTNESRNYLYNGTYYHHYARVNISSIAYTDVVSAKLVFTAMGSIAYSIYEVEGDFTPGVTTAGELPDSGMPLGELGTSDGVNSKFTVDITECIKRLAKEGKTSFGYVVSQNSASTNWIGSEKSSSTYRPYLEITYRALVDPVVISDIKTSASSMYKKANVSITNNSEECFGEYVFIGASYDGDKLAAISISDPTVVMPYRTKEFSAQLPVGYDAKFFLWKTNGQPVKMTVK